MFTVYQSQRGTAITYVGFIRTKSEEHSKHFKTEAEARNWAINLIDELRKKYPDEAI